MSKRFTDTDKWDDKWFRRLSSTDKLVFIYILDRCNLAGFWEVDLEILHFQTGLTCEQTNSTLERLERGLIRVGDRVWVKNFLSHQKNLPLNPLNNAHKKIIYHIKERTDFEEAQTLLPDYDGSFIKVNLSDRETIWVRDGGECVYCGRVISGKDDFHVDHIHPRSKGGGDAYTNRAASCSHCNLTKSDKIVDKTVENISASDAKKILKGDDNLRDRFNAFFDRHLELKGQSIVDVHSGASISPIGKGIGKGIGISNGKGKYAVPVAYSESFNSFWEYYPNKKSKKVAWKSWEKQKLDDRCQEMITAIQKQSVTIYKGVEPRYIPHGATWLNGARWEDDCSVAKPKGKSGNDGACW